MPRAASAAPKKRAGPKAVKLAEQFTKGTVLIDVLKKQWRLGEVIGQGGFGLVYHANTGDSSVTSQNAQFVVKIEPGSNGPLFCEMNFYIRAAKRQFIDEFIKARKLRYLAVPPYIGSGLHTYNSVSYRFLVMPRYGTDLQKLLDASGGVFLCSTVFAIGLRMIDALEYLHEKEYVHADVKASNILVGFDGHSENTDRVYLADYGLAFRYTANNKHKEYKVDPRSAHNGSLEFTSRDAHKGAFPSRRGDLEILGFCLLQWLCKKLPWESHLTNPNIVAQKKEEYMEDVGSLVKTCLRGQATYSSDCVLKFLQEVSKLGYEENPKYTKFKDLLKSGLTKSGQKDEWRIQFQTGAKGTKRKSEDTVSPRVSPKKKPKTAAGSKAIPMPKTPDVVSPLKKKGGLPKKSPVVNGKKHSTASPMAKAAKAVPKSASPLVIAGRKSPAQSTAARKRIDKSKPKKTFQIPPPSKPSPKQSPATSRPKAASSTVRRVRKAHVSRSDASIQTTPGLKTNH